MGESRDELKIQNGKFGEHLTVITQEVAALGKTIVPEGKEGEFEIKDKEVDPKRQNETFSTLRVMLAKAKHYQQTESRNIAELKNELEVSSNNLVTTISRNHGWHCNVMSIVFHTP